MGRFKTFALAAGALTIAAAAIPAAMSVAQAADLLPPPLYPVAPIVDVASGWYLRGEVGVSAYSGGKFSSSNQPPSVFYGQDFGSGAFAGGGFGYQFNNWFRADVTGEYRFSNGVRVFDYTNFIDGGGFPAIARETTQGNYKGAVFLLNGYVDLGTWWGVTPFVGGGVGWAYNRLTNFNDFSQIEDPIGGPVSTSGGVYQAGNKSGLAWAIHAGLSYAVTHNLKLELAYRYLNLGDAKTGTLNCFCGQTFTGITSKDLVSQDIMFGMRWLLAGPIVAPIEAPLVRKY
jgi:opacity protein-like surface antigen